MEGFLDAGEDELYGNRRQDQAHDAGEDTHPGLFQQAEPRHDAKRLDGDAEELEDEVPERGEEHQHCEDDQRGAADHRRSLGLGVVWRDGQEDRDVAHGVQRDEERHERGDEERQQRVHQRPTTLALLSVLRGSSVDDLASSLYNSRSPEPTDCGAIRTTRTYWSPRPPVRRGSPFPRRRRRWPAWLPGGMRI